LRYHPRDASLIIDIHLKNNNIIMKAIYKFILSLFLISSTCFIGHAEKLFDEISTLDGVKSIYVSNVMLKLAGSLGLNEIEGLSEYSPLMKDVTAIEILSVTDKSKVKKRRKKIDKFVKNLPNTETISEVTENGKADTKTVTVKTHINSYTREENGLIIYIKQDSQISLIHLEGTINPDALGTI
jgi:prenyltransferase beta subunit